MNIIFMNEVGISIISQMCAYAYLYLKGNTKKEKKQRLFFILICTAVTFAAFFCIHTYTEDLLEFTRYMILYQILFCAAIIDYDRRIIPNLLIWFGIFVQTLLGILELCVFRNIEKSSLITRGAEVFLTASLLGILYVVSKHAIGFGDVKLLCMSTFLCGFIQSFSIFFYALLAIMAVTLLLIIVKKVHRKHTLPFAPFLLIGFFLTLLLE